MYTIELMYSCTYVLLSQTAVITRVRTARRSAGIGMLLDDTSFYLEAIDALLLEMCCARVQRAYREFLHTFRAFGPLIFSLASQQPSPCGTLRFPAGRAASLAPFLCVSDKSDPKLLAYFMKWHWQLAAGGASSAEARHRPEVLISVMGSAQDFKLTAELNTLFERGLVGAATEARAVFFAGGTNAGVIALIGSVLEEAGVQAPLVGVAPLPALRQRHLLSKHNVAIDPYSRPVDYDHEELPAPTDTKIAPPSALNPNTTHFLCVHDGRPLDEAEPLDEAGKAKGKFPYGVELGLRAKVELEYAKLMRIPSVQLLVQGGPGSLFGCLQSMKAGIPVLAIVDSGGACQAIHEFCSEEKHSDGTKPDENKPHEYTPCRKIRNPTLLKAFGKENLVAQLNEIADLLVKNDSLLQFYKMKSDGSSGGGNEVLHSLLGTIVGAKLAEAEKLQGKDRAAHLASVLALAVRWDAPEVAPPIIHALGGGGLAARTNAVLIALQQALELQRNDFVYMLLDLSGLDAMNVDLFRLYTLPEDVNIISHHAGLQAGLSEARKVRLQERSFTQQATALVGFGGPRRSNQQLPEASEQKAAVARADDYKDKNMQYTLAVRRFFDEITPQLARVLLPKREKDNVLWAREQDGGAHQSVEASEDVSAVDTHEPDIHEPAATIQRKPTAKRSQFEEEALKKEKLRAARHGLAIDNVFCWAILVGNHELAKILWRRSGRPLQMALFGAQINEYIAANVYVDKQSFIDRAAEMQGWAMGAMDAAPDQAIAHRLLAHVVHVQNPRAKSTGGRTVLDLALLLEQKDFLAQRHSISLMKKLWLGWSVEDGPLFELRKDRAHVTQLIFLLFLPIPWLNPHLQKLKDAANDAEISVEGMMRSVARVTKYAAEQQAVISKRHASTILTTENTHRFEARAMMTATTAAVHRRRDVTMLERVCRFYLTPKVKYTGRMCTHTAMLALYFAVLTCSEARIVRAGAPVPQLTPLEYVWFSCVCANTLDFMYCTVVRARLGIRATGTSLAHVYSRIRGVCFVLACITRLSARWITLEFLLDAQGNFAPIGNGALVDAACDLYLWYTRIVSFAVVWVALAYLEFFSEHRGVGQLVIMFDKMVLNMGPWLILFLVFILGFMIAFVGFDAAGLMRNEAAQPFAWGVGNASIATTLADTIGAIDEEPFTASMMVPMWAAFGEFEGDHYDFYGSAFMWLYCLISQVILVNLLVAVYADQYNKISATAESENAWMRYASIFDYRAVKTAVPPPFNAPWTLYHLVLELASRISGARINAMRISRRLSAQVLPDPTSDDADGDATTAARDAYPVDESAEAKKARQRYVERAERAEQEEKAVLNAIEEVREKQNALENTVAGIESRMKQKVDEAVIEMKEAIRASKS